MDQKAFFRKSFRREGDFCMFWGGGDGLEWWAPNEGATVRRNEAAINKTYASRDGENPQELGPLDLEMSRLEESGILSSP